MIASPGMHQLTHAPVLCTAPAPHSPGASHDGRLYARPHRARPVRRLRPRGIVRRLAALERMAEAAPPERQAGMNSCLIVYQDAEWRIVRHQCGRAQPYTLWERAYYGWGAARLFFSEQGARGSNAREKQPSPLQPGAPPPG